MQMIGLARLGQDGVVRFLPDGSPVLNLALAFNYGKKDANGKRLTQWVDAAMFGERGSKLQPYMVKGQQLLVHLSEPHMEVYTARDGTQGAKMSAFIQHIEFAGDAPNRQAVPAPAAERAPTREEVQNRQRPAPAPAANGGGASGFDDLEIPF